MNIYQSFDCPNCGIDFDLEGEEILTVGESVNCPGCGQQHTAEEVDLDQTAIMVKGGSYQYRGLPQNAEEKAAWIAEVGEMLQANSKLIEAHIEIDREELKTILSEYLRSGYGDIPDDVQIRVQVTDDDGYMFFRDVGDEMPLLINFTTKVDD